jgi:RNA polymerase-associated protein RTF1
LKAIQYALTYRFSSTDVDKILASKEKFAKGPKNYAMHKAKLMKDKVNAQVEGRAEEVEELDMKLAELEERAEKLDKARTGSLSNISFINDRNRKGNVMRAEQGIRGEKTEVGRQS